MIKLNMGSVDKLGDITEGILPFTTRTASNVCIYTKDDKNTYNCLQISDEGEWIESFNYASFEEMIDDALAFGADEVFCDLEITVL